jgi:oligoribonuclease NrnB/cAMP/cGMP phosphodiesterase (DHH superfamily)
MTIGEDLLHKLEQEASKQEWECVLGHLQRINRMVKEMPGQTSQESTFWIERSKFIETLKTTTTWEDEVIVRIIDDLRCQGWIQSREILSRDNAKSAPVVISIQIRLSTPVNT